MQWQKIVLVTYKKTMLQLMTCVGKKIPHILGKTKFTHLQDVVGSWFEFGQLLRQREFWFIPEMGLNKAYLNMLRALSKEEINFCDR